MIDRRSWVAVWLVGLLVTAACGEEATLDAGVTGGSGGGDNAGGSGGEDKDAEPAGGTDAGPTGGGGGSDEPTDGGTSTPPGDAGGEPCGAVICEEPMCCSDPFVSSCGVRVNQACLMPPDESIMSDDRCPSVSIMGIFNLPSCCTTDGDCGIDASMFGGGCTELSVAAERAMMMGAGAMIMWPEPRKCE